MQQADFIHQLVTSPMGATNRPGYITGPDSPPMPPRACFIIVMIELPFPPLDALLHPFVPFRLC
jgi:hypothetical protein